MNPRTKIVKYLIKITENKTVEQQLRDQWLRELQDQKDAEQHQRELEQQAQESF